METEIPIMNEEIVLDELDNVDLIDNDENNMLDGLDDKSDATASAQDPYDTFMRRHLQHYGYFTGRNASYRNNYDGLENWHRNYDLRLSGTQSLTVDEEKLRKMGHFPPHRNATVDSNLGQFFSEGQPPDDLLSRTTQLVFHYQSGKKIPKLREPRNLYALTKEPGPQQATRWPSHMQVVCSSIHFIEYIPPVPDPFYLPTGKEATPAVRGTPTGEIVYLNDPGRDVYFMRSRVAGCRLAMRDISLTPRESVDDGNFTLEFESRFESGNLLKAVKINDFDYELTLRPDLYTNKHTQWFFFRVRNMVPDKKYRFTIVNLMKPSSLYNHGMKPLFYSDTNAKKSKTGWCREGVDIRYFRNNLGSMSGRTFYSLTWTIQFPHKGDTCYFAHCYPYTYTDLQEYLLKLANDPVRSRFCKQRVLCRTLAGNLVYILTVTSPSRNPEISSAKKAVVLTARVHPGETNSSWMMKGLLDFLSGNSADAKLLRDNFIFKIVPMLNPDGVIVGNYRCSLAGRDLNRNYKSVLKDSFPSVWHVKMMAKRLNMEREVILYCDLHGHSRKNNIFIYGCENKNNPQRKFRERIFPLMLSKNAKTKFQYESCKFKIQKSKEGTGRVVMWCLGIMNSYTMEATFGGTSLGSRKGTHFSTQDLEEMGHNFCDTILDYCDPDSAKVEACYQEIQDRVRKQIMKKMQMRNMQGSIGDVNLDDFSSEYESDTSGSDSSCDDGLPVHLLAIAPKLQRKRRLKSRTDRNKQTARKSAPVQEEPKLTPSHGPKPIVEKQKPIRYSQTAGSKRRDDNNHVSVGTASHSGGYAEDRTPKKSDYLEALTTAYIRSGVLMVPEKKEYSMRYTSGMGKPQNSNNSTVQYIAGQLSNLTESGSEHDTIPLMRNAACQWSPQPDVNFDSDNRPYDDETKDAVLAEEQYEILRKSALRRQLSPAQQRVLAQRHLVAVAQMQQRREQTRTIPATSIVHRGGTPLKQHPNPFDEIQDDLSGPPRVNSRCTSATQRQDTRKTSLQSASRPGSREPIIRATTERTHISSDNITMSSSDTKVPTNKKASTVPPSTETTIKDEELILNKANVQTVINSQIKTIKHVPQESTTNNLTTDFFTPKIATDSTKSMHETMISSVKNDVDRRTSAEKTKSQSILVFGSSENMFVNNMTPSNTEVTENFLPENSIVFQQSTSFSQNKRGSIDIKKAPSEQEKSKEPDPIFGESLDMLPTQDQHEQRSSSQHNKKSKPKSQASVLSEDLNSNDVSLEKLPMQWGGRKQLITLDVNSESSPEPVKRERARILSANKKAPLSNVIAEGHGSRYRAKNFKGKGDEDSYFGMSDNVGPVTLKHGVRVPPVVANIAELRRSLMGHGREDKEDDQSIRSTSHTQLRQKHQHHAKNESNSPEDKRRNVNLRPRPHHRYHQTSSLIEEEYENDMNVDTLLNKHETITEKDEYLSKIVQRKKERRDRRHNSIPTKLNPNENPVNHLTLSSSDFEDFVEEKWPTPNESEIRSYSQGNATIEKLNDNSLTNIRFGSRTNEHSRKLKEQWIDVHQRQVVSHTAVGRQDIAMSSLSLNIDGDMDEKHFATTPALAKRPVPPLLRYLSAKQTIKKKW